MSAPLYLRAYAKINLTLFVGARGDDGYHPLDSLVEPIGLYDEITLQTHLQGDLIVVRGAQLPTDASNLALAAARLLRAEAAPRAPGCRIELRKHIPVGGGLGGGSADASAVLRGLNRLWQCGLDDAQLGALGARLGADVPACLLGRPLVMRGRGEQLEALPPPPAHWVVVVHPGVEASTKAVYAAFDQLPPPPAGSSAEAVRALIAGEWSSLPAACRNDLYPVAIKVCPAIEQAAQTLMEAGAEQPLLTGSGAGLFALFADAQRAQHVRARLNGRVAFSWCGPAGVDAVEPVLV